MKIGNTIILIQDRPTLELMIIKSKLASVGITGYSDVWEVFKSYYPNDIKTNIMPVFSLNRKVNEEVLNKFKNVLNSEEIKHQ